MRNIQSHNQVWMELIWNVLKSYKRHRRSDFAACYACPDGETCVAVQGSDADPTCVADAVTRCTGCLAGQYCEETSDVAAGACVDLAVTEAPTEAPTTTPAPITTVAPLPDGSGHNEVGGGIHAEIVNTQAPVPMDACGDRCAFGMMCNEEEECVLSVKSKTAFGIIFGTCGILAGLLILFLVILPAQKAKKAKEDEESEE